ncbi:MAG: hypothetical protein ACYDCQ_12345 [Dehalococcoidia bacterium]
MIGVYVCDMDIKSLNRAAELQIASGTIDTPTGLPHGNIKAVFTTD